jgi:hypothetical protein
MGRVYKELARKRTNSITFERLWPAIFLATLLRLKSPASATVKMLAADPSAVVYRRSRSSSWSTALGGRGILKPTTHSAERVALPSVPFFVCNIIKFLGYID